MIGDFLNVILTLKALQPFGQFLLNLLKALNFFRLNGGVAQLSKVSAA